MPPGRRPGSHARREAVRFVEGLHALALALGGVAIGLVGALAPARVLDTLLFGISPGDPVTLVGVALTLVAVAAAASYLPARRAVRVDPMVALRGE